MWPFGQVVSLSSLSNISLEHDLTGCGACLEVKCTDDYIRNNICFSGSPTQIVSVYDICATSGYSISCGPNELAMPAYVFQKLAPFQRGFVSVEYRQIECEPQANITLVIEQYQPGSAGQLRIRLKNVAGDGAISQVELRNMPSSSEDAGRDLNSFWQNMTKAGLSGFELNGLPQTPIDLRLISGDKQIIVLRNAITENTKIGELNTFSQFKIGAFPTRFPVVQDLSTIVQSQQTLESAVISQNQVEEEQSCECTDEVPTGVPFSCEDQLRYGRCEEPFMISGDWCSLTCGRCRCTPSTQQQSYSYSYDQDTVTSPPPPPPPSPPTLQDPPLLVVDMPKGVENNTICPMSLEGLLFNSPDLRRFYEGLEAVGLTERLRDPYLALTILAPNNYAFDLLSQSTGIEWETLKAQYPGLLQRILLYNLLPGVWDSRKFLGLQDSLRLITLLPYSSLEISTFTGRTGLNITGPANSAQTIWRDLSICKSIIHYTDTVMLPFVDYRLMELAEFPQVTEFPGFLDMNGTQSDILDDDETNNIIPVNDTDSNIATIVLPDDLEVQESPPSPLQFVTAAITPVQDARFQEECGYDQGFQDVVQCPSVLRILERTPCLGIFLELVRIANYESHFENVALAQTIFTPTNSSFEAFFRREGLTLAQISREQIQVGIMLGYHVLNRPYTREQLQLIASSENNSVNTQINIQGDPLPLKFTSTQDGQKVVVQGVGSNATIEREVYSCESIIQIVDNVLLPTESTPQNEPIVPIQPNSISPEPADPFQGLIASPQPYSYPTPYIPPLSGNLPDINAVQPEQQQNAQICQKITMQQFFVERGSGQGELRFFDVMLVLSKLQNQVYFASKNLIVLVPTNNGIDRGLASINETFTSLLGSTNQGLSVLVEYHVLQREDPLEGLFQSGNLNDVMGVQTSYGRNTVKISNSDFNERGELISISGDQTKANVVERVETCNGVVYVLDNLLLPQGFSLGL